MWGVHVDDYLRRRRRRGEIAVQTERNARAILNDLDRSVGKRLGDLRKRDVERWLEGMDGLSAATKRTRWSCARGFVRWAVAEGILDHDPMAKVQAPRQPRSIPRAMAADRVTRTLAACPNLRGRLIVLLMVQMGLRCCEVAGLDRGDIDWGRWTVRVKGKGGHERVLPIPDEVRAPLEDYVAKTLSRSGPVIRSVRHPSRGLDADTISGMVSRWMDEAGVKMAQRDGVSAHALRHTAATDMLRAGAHLRDVQAALGHAHLQTTEIYLPLIVNGLEEAMAGRRYA